MLGASLTFPENHPMSKMIGCLLVLLLPALAPAADASYSLFEGLVKISAPADWPVMLKKTEGVPQVIAFQVTDPSDPNNGQLSHVSIESKLLNDASTYQALVNAGTDRAKQTPGYEEQKSADANVIRYAGLDGKQRYEYRESWSLNTKVLTHVRCSRPLLATASAAWVAAYEAGCAQIMQSIRH
jgi:hypothetical protein